MKYRAMGTSVLLALLVFAGLATAQSTTTPTFETAVTTGIVGWAPALQAAQLNVLNTAGVVPVAATASAAVTTTTPPVAACPVELEFRDGQNNVLKSLEVSNVAPGTAASLTLKLADLTTATTALRIDIRGVVRSNPFVSGPIPAGGGTMIPAFAFGACSIMPTLELFDTVTGMTQVVTSDTRAFGTLVAVPLSIKN
ncbi:MAG: hypothetical protein ABSE42_17350 [Bryobacteraceae bacterium]|jgi:hypothetical protein